jgi:hypothetical protein
MVKALYAEVPPGLPAKVAIEIEKERAAAREVYHLLFPKDE